MEPSAPRIAIVDDDPSVGRSLVRLLRASRMSAEAYTSGEALLRALPRQAPDCLLVDILMPGMNGFELVRRIEAAGMRFPVVFITALRDGLEPLGPPSSRPLRILQKPFEDRALLSELLAAMEEGTPWPLPDSNPTASPAP